MCCYNILQDSAWKLRLTKRMAAHYGKPVILLVDEYDVPLAKADEKGYYSEMLDVVKGVMQVVKDNEALQTAVITGCLRIAKESIFTGMVWLSLPQCDRRFLFPGG